jgi:hypothetical protein
LNTKALANQDDKIFQPAHFAKGHSYHSMAFCLFLTELDLSIVSPKPAWDPKYLAS